jgi:hypothetical protein
MLESWNFGHSFNPDDTACDKNFSLIGFVKPWEKLTKLFHVKNLPTDDNWELWERKCERV